MDVPAVSEPYRRIVLQRLAIAEADVVSSLAGLWLRFVREVGDE
jgi:hypothetical protein